MREILFRGKRVGNGEWVEGFYAELPFPVSSAASPMDRTIRDLYTAPCIISVSKKPYSLYCGELSPKGFVTRVDQVILETVGEYTGLTDKNGKRIFEGDIVRYRPEYWSEPHWSIVEYCADKWNYPAFDLKDHDYEGNGLQFAHEEGVWLEVIGNIHDNPELLEVKE